MYFKVEQFFLGIHVLIIVIWRWNIIKNTCIYSYILQINENPTATKINICVALVQIITPLMTSAKKCKFAPHIRSLLMLKCLNFGVFLRISELFLCFDDLKLLFTN